ncbi:MAG: NTP transferase domain-containing protein [Candidatus Binatia bacterium]
MKVLLLSAGQGRRLGALTESAPKCLLPLAGRPLLQWQVLSLAAAGVDEVVVVTGFGADQVEAELENPFYQDHGRLRVRTLYNPDFATSDNLMSCWAARAEMTTDFMIVNGDTLFEPAIVTELLRSRTSPISIAVTIKTTYDVDDMKVSVVDGLVRQVAKTIPMDQVSAEAIGLSAYRGDGARRMHDTIVDFAARPNSHRMWYLSAVSHLAGEGHVGTAPIEDLACAEVDYPADVEQAESVLMQRIEPILFPKLVVGAAARRIDV